MRARLVLAALFVAACGSSEPESPSPALEPQWSLELPARAQGVAVHPETGELYLSVTSGEMEFSEGGGVLAVSPEGTIVHEAPMVLPRPCEGCTRLIFAPNQPLIAEGGDGVWVSDHNLDLFRFDTSDRTIRLVAPQPPPTYLTGIDAGATVMAHGGEALLAGNRLVRLNLVQPALEEIDVGAYVRQVVSLGEGDYLLNVTDPYGSEGALVLWSEEGIGRIDLPDPVVALASRDGWTVAVVELALGEYGLLELDPASGTAEALATFALPTGPITLALLPARRQVAVGSGGIQAVGDGEIALLTGSTVLVDAEEGAIAGAETGSVAHLALSPDGSTLYVADTGGLHAFALP